MFKKMFEYAGPHKKDLYSATFIVLLSVLMGVLPFVLAYQVISPLVMGETVGIGYVSMRVIGVLICLILQAVLYGWGLDVSHKAAYNTLLRLRTSLQKRFEALPLGFIQDKGTGTIKKLFVDDVDSLEVLLAHSLPEGIANLMIPIAIYVAMPGIYSDQLCSHDDYVFRWYEENGTVLHGRAENEQYHYRVYQRYGSCESVQ